MASIFRAREEFAKAAEYFGRVVGIAPESGDAWGALGSSLALVSLVLTCDMCSRDYGSRATERTAHDVSLHK